MSPWAVLSRCREANPLPLAPQSPQKTNGTISHANTPIPRPYQEPHPFLAEEEVVCMSDNVCAVLMAAAC